MKQFRGIESEVRVFIRFWVFSTFFGCFYCNFLNRPIFPSMRFLKVYYFVLDVFRLQHQVSTLLIRFARFHQHKKYLYCRLLTKETMFHFQPKFHLFPFAAEGFSSSRYCCCSLSLSLSLCECVSVLILTFLTRKFFHLFGEMLLLIFEMKIISLSRGAKCTWTLQFRAHTTGEITKWWIIGECHGFSYSNESKTLPQ